MIDAFEPLKSIPHIHLGHNAQYDKIFDEIVTSGALSATKGYSPKSTWKGLTLFTGDQSEDDHYLPETGPYSLNKLDLERSKVYSNQSAYPILIDSHKMSAHLVKPSEREMAILGNNLFDIEIRMKNARPTSWLNKMPLLKKLLIESKVLGPPGRTRLTLLKPGGKLDFHSHFRFFKDAYVLPYVYLVSHLVIQTNSKCSMDVQIDHEVHSAQYSEGDIWIFNAWHPHRVVNNGSTDRIHIINFSYTDEMLAFFGNQLGRLMTKDPH